MAVLTAIVCLSSCLRATVVTKVRSSFARWSLVVAVLAILGMTAVPWAAAAERPWQTLSDPTAAEAARVFASPPPEYSAQFTWGWAGPVDRNVIARDLDGMKALGVYAAAIEPKTGMKHPYLSPEYFNLVGVAVEEAKKRNMRLWIMDDGDYPSGLAGGKFTTERPDLRMKALAAPETTAVAGGSSFTRETGDDFVCCVATDKRSGTTRLLEPVNHRVEWTAPGGTDWQVSIVRWQFRTMPTRSANNPANVKDTTHSLMDYLDPAATEQFKQWTFDGYRAAIGSEFGKTVLGFRGDEPAYGFTPWTPSLLAEFERRKHYDLRPFLPAFAGSPAARIPSLSEEERRVYADYCDVWSDLYRDHYFDMEAAWCAEHGLEMQLHIEHEDILPQLAISDGDFFKVFRHIQVPGIDIIWHQLWMDNPADFPKLASSAAHLYGHPRSMCEAFAAYRPAPDLKQAKWLLDFLLSRGITRIEYMFWPASVPRTGGRPASTPADGSKAPSGTNASSTATTKASGGSRPSGFMPRYYRDPGFPAVAAYVNRLSYLLGEGKPAADIGLYIPSSSFWVADAQEGRRINDALLAIAHQLIEHQRDFDFVDEQALSSVLELRNGALVNLSGQPYHAIIVPPSAAISKAALECLQAFARKGGRVLFLGDAPTLVVANSFREATGPADVSWATLREPTPAVTPAVLAALPPPDVTLGSPAPLVSSNHRVLRDADVYFLFNSGDEPFSGNAQLAGAGQAEIWDAASGEVKRIASAASATTQHDDPAVTVPLQIPAWSTTVVVLNHSNSN